MKYIKLYEAFESEAITNTIKFLTKKIGQKNTDSFFNDIKRLMTQYDIPISRIKENDLEYIRVSKAIKVKNNEPVNNNWNIYCIKYWFSIDQGFLGKTCTGNLTTPYVKIENDYSYKNKNFDEDQFNYIKNKNLYEKTYPEIIQTSLYHIDSHDPTSLYSGLHPREYFRSCP